MSVLAVDDYVPSTFVDPGNGWGNIDWHEDLGGEVLLNANNIGYINTQVDTNTDDISLLSSSFSTAKAHYDTQLSSLREGQSDNADGVSIAAAMAALPQATNGENMFALSGSYINGVEGYAVGLGTNFGDSNQYTIQVQYGKAHDTEGGAIGFGLAF